MTDVRSATIDSRHDGFALSAWRADATGERRGGVVVIQEIFGLTDHIGEMCAAFAAAGYDAIAPGMFDRVDKGFLAPVDPEGMARGRAAVAATPWDQVAADVQSALDLLAPPRFVVGFCYGGAAAWLAAARCSGLSAASCFYGRQIVDLLDERPRAPVMLHYGARDASIPETDRARVAAIAGDAPIHIYDAGHGFCRRGGHDHDAAACTLAMARTLEWFARWRG